MTRYISSHVLDAMGERLRVYDVDQSGWEHEGQGLEFNLAHVVKHLTRDLHRKDFFDRRSVTSQIVPDGLQYALRLARWVGVNPDKLIPGEGTTDAAEGFSRRMRLASPRLGSYTLATSRLADLSHDMDHKETRADTVNNCRPAVVEAGRLLVLSAHQSVAEFEFDLAQSFDARMTDLRTRFGIPNPG